MSVKRVFVTVGTTQFDKLVKELSRDEILDVLHSLGYGIVQFQVGTGIPLEKTHVKVKLKYDKYFENFSEVIENSDLIISHAGAGTCLEVLKKRKPIIVVINEDLMDNHQIELAEHLAKEGYLKCCNIPTLKQILVQNNFSQMKPYPEPNSRLFSDYLDKCMGFQTK